MLLAISSPAKAGGISRRLINTSVIMTYLLLQSYFCNNYFSATSVLFCLPIHLIAVANIQCETNLPSHFQYAPTEPNSSCDSISFSDLLIDDTLPCASQDKSKYDPKCAALFTEVAAEAKLNGNLII